MGSAPHIHLLGVCGTFMAGLAVLARQLDYRVSGSDANVYPPMDGQLERAGIEVREGYHETHLQPAPDWVIVGNAMTRGNAAVEYLLNSTIRYTSGPQWLAEQVLAGRWPLAVAGTHGKTSTSAMLAWLLQRNGIEAGFLIGGIPANFEVSARLGSAPLFVVEADEYDSAFFDKRSKFIHYRPRTVVLNNLEFDHADIFPDLAAIERQFHHLVRTLPANGLVISNAAELHLESVLAQGCWTPIQRFGSRAGDWQARLLEADGSAFEVFFRGKLEGRVAWSQIGRHNVSNALAAVAAAHHGGVPVAAALEALGEYAGVKRRLEVRGVVGGVTVYDDFAHHPSAIAATLEALRARVGKQRILALLELRSNTMRGGRFLQQLSPALLEADRSFVYLDPKLAAAPIESRTVHHAIEPLLAAVLDQATSTLR